MMLATVLTREQENKSDKNFSLENKPKAGCKVSQLENDRQTYINYIETVSEICGIGAVLKDMEKIKALPLKELDRLSRTVESVYNLHLENEAYGKLLEEIEEMGVDYVRNKYLNKGEGE